MSVTWWTLRDEIALTRGQSTGACLVNTNGVSMRSGRTAQSLADTCLRAGKYQPSELLQWLVADVLADFGVRHQQPPPADVLGWLRDTAGQYARAVAERPYEDVLGGVYQELGSRGHRSALGQFFTPDAVSTLIGAMLATDEQHARRRADGGLWRVCEPACGSGALILGFMRSLTETHGKAALAHWSISAIDLDSLCARMCAAQVLSNLLLHRGTLGEFVVYQGNALGPRTGLSVVAHTTVADLTPDIVLPALHPSRIAALRDAARSGLTEDRTASARAVENGGLQPHKDRDAVTTRGPMVDLFAD